MISTIDLLFLLLIILLYMSGWRKGLLKSLVAPGALFICVLWSIIYFDLTQNFIMALIITFIGSFALSLSIKFLIMIGYSSVDKKHSDNIFWGSRFLGGLTNAIYKGGLFLVFLILLSLLPGKDTDFIDLQDKIISSKTYFYTRKLIAHSFPKTNTALETIAIFKDDKQIKELTSMKEFQDFASDQKIQDMLKDPEIQKHIKDNNITKFATHPSVTALIRDDKIMKKFTNFTLRIYGNKMEEKGLLQPKEEALLDKLKKKKY